MDQPCPDNYSTPTNLTQTMARFAWDLQFTDLPPAVIQAASTAVADALACGIAAVSLPGPTLLRQYALARGSRPESTLLGSRTRVCAPLAALVNSALVRELDANDLYAGPPGRDTGHFSDAIPALLAIAERTGVSGAEFLTAVVIAYELQAVLAEAYLWMRRGLHSVSQIAWAIPPAAGRLLGLAPDVIVSALGLAGSTAGLVLQSWLHPMASLPLLKGAAPGFVACRALEAIDLAAMGFTGPTQALETLFTLIPSDPDVTPFQRLERPFHFTLPRTMYKLYPCQINIQAAVQAAITLHPCIRSLAAIEKVTVYGHHGLVAGVQGAAAAYVPETQAAADHSTPFAVAVALRDGQLTPATYQSQPWRDPQLRALMRRIELVVDHEYFEPAYVERGQYGCRLAVQLRDGQQLVASVMQQKGHPDAPLTRAELLAKLQAFVDPQLGSGAGERLLASAEALPNAANVGDLIAACSGIP